MDIENALFGINVRYPGQFDGGDTEYALLANIVFPPVATVGADIEDILFAMVVCRVYDDHS